MGREGIDAEICLFDVGFVVVGHPSRSVSRMEVGERARVYQDLDMIRRVSFCSDQK